MKSAWQQAGKVMWSLKTCVQVPDLTLFFNKGVQLRWEEGRWLWVKNTFTDMVDFALSLYLFPPHEKEWWRILLSHCHCHIAHGGPLGVPFCTFEVVSLKRILEIFSFVFWTVLKRNCNVVIGFFVCLLFGWFAGQEANLGPVVRAPRPRH